MLFATLAELDGVLTKLQIERMDLPWCAAHIAGQAFVAYRKRGGLKTAPLPDFYIFAHRLKLNSQFQAAFVENGTVAWPGNIDIDPETLYELSVALEE